MSTDAIVMLKDDHKEILRAFRDFENAGDDAHKTKGNARREDHRAAHRAHLHRERGDVPPRPRARPRARGRRARVLRGAPRRRRPRHGADGDEPDDERFTAKTTVLIENVRHHIEEEEDEWFPQVREALGRKVLQDIGAEMAEARKKAPRSPAQPSALKKTIDAVIS